MHIFQLLNKKYSNRGFMVSIVSTIHLFWGFIVLTYGSLPPTTTLFPLSELFVFPYGALSLIISACLAYYSIKIKCSNYSPLLILPQQFFLILSTYGVMTAIATSSFADGVVRPWQFIASDQVMWLVLMVFYTYAIISRNSLEK